MAEPDMEHLAVVETDRHPRRARRRAGFALLRVFGRTVFYVVLGIAFSVSAALGVGSVIDVHEPTYWGTFTVHRCEPTRYGCQSIGTWTSDDKRIVRHDIALDGDTGSDGVIRASYTPSGFNSDAENNIVHTGMWSGAKFWFPWVFCVVVALLVITQARSWRRRDRARGERVNLPRHDQQIEERSDSGRL